MIFTVRKFGIAAGAVFIALVFTAIFMRSMGSGLNHDEHQFLAPGALLAREGIQPYTDYPLFHLPNLTLAYAALDRVSPYLIFNARLLSLVCTGALLVVLYVCAHRSLAGRGPWVRFSGASALVLLLVCDPLFLRTTGRTWNHEAPVLLLVVAILCHLRAMSAPAHRWMLLGGLATGLAIGTRLTFAPVALPLFCAAFLLPAEKRQRCFYSLTFAAAVTVAMAPSLYYFVRDPQAFLFGNFEFPRLALLDPANERVHKTMAWWRKLRYLVKEILLPGTDGGNATGSFALFVTFLALGVAPGVAWLRTRKGSAGAALVLLVLPFVLVGACAPSRYQAQHFYALVPCFALAAACGIGHARWLSGRGVTLLWLLVLVSLVITRNEWTFKRPAEWYPFRMHAAGTALRQRIGDGKVLTLAPTVPLEGGLRIYSEFATGLFALRNAPFVAPERRKRLHILAPEDFEAHLAADPPAAIWTGFEDEKYERPLIRYAQRHGYTPAYVENKSVLWLPQRQVSPR